MAKATTETSTEIIEAARKQFLIHGYEGARLQKIADQIGATKAMIHYYFNTKQELFERVFTESVDHIYGKLSETLEKDLPLFKKIEVLIDECLQIADEHSQVLSFVITESNRKPEWLGPIIKQQISIELQQFDNELQDAASDYQITSVDANTLLLQIFSLCYYPVLSTTLNQALFSDGIENNSEKIDRKGLVLDTILNWLTA